MDRAKAIMGTLLLNNQDALWEIDRTRLALTIESWFPREKKRDDPVRYTTVEEQRELRLTVIGNLFGRGANNPLTSFKVPTADEPDNMALTEAKALAVFIQRMSLDVHGEVKDEYYRVSKEMLDDKEREWKIAEAERQRLESLGQVDGFGDIQLLLPDLLPSGTG